MAKHKYKTKEILICNACKGTGLTEHSELVDYHKHEYDYWDDICSECKGSGRLLKKVMTIEKITPYDNPQIAKLMFEKLKDN